MQVMENATEIVFASIVFEPKFQHHSSLKVTTVSLDFFIK